MSYQDLLTKYKINIRECPDISLNPGLTKCPLNKPRLISDELLYNFIHKAYL